MKRLYTLLFSFLLFLLLPQAVAALDISKSFSEIFIENKGQVKDEKNNAAQNVLFYSQGTQMQLFITHSGYSLVTSESNKQKTTFHKIDFALQNVSINAQQIVFVKGNFPAFNFYHAQNVLEDVHSAAMVIVRNVYPGIDWVWSFDKNKNPKHEFMVNIGADASVVKYKVSGADAKLSEGNTLIYSNENLAVKEGPVIFQKQAKEFAASISVQNNDISFKIPDELKAGGFTIDPPLELLWGAALDTLRTSFKSIVADGGLNTITVGYSGDYAVPTFPQVNGSYSVYPAKATDVIIMKTDANQNLIWATFLAALITMKQMQ